MKSKKFNFLVAAAFMGLVLLSTSCSKSNDGGTNNGYDGGTNKPGQPSATGVQLSANTKFGNIITDNNGRALYFFSIDANGSSGCNDGCALVWTAFYKASPAIGTGLNTADFGVITRADGSKQNTYKGWPLYYYQGDANVGDTNGDGIAGTWFVAKADYTVMLANAQLVGNNGIQYTSALIPGQEITQYITDDHGRTLYTFSADKAKKNNFTKPDFSNDASFPIDVVDAVHSIPSILDKAQFDVITVFGKVQLTYKGWPLYYFGADAATRGNTKGVSVPTPGVWPVINKNSPAAPAN